MKNLRLKMLQATVGKMIGPAIEKLEAIENPTQSEQEQLDYLRLIQAGNFEEAMQSPLFQEMLEGLRRAD